MKDVPEVLATRAFVTLERMIAVGSRVRTDDPIVVANPTWFAPAPPRDGTLVAIRSAITKRGMLLSGAIVGPEDPIVKTHPDYFIAGPVDPGHLRPLATAASYNHPRALARRRAEHELALARQAATRRHAEEQAERLVAEATAAGERLKRKALGAA